MQSFNPAFFHVLSFLGTSSGVPCRTRNVSSYALTLSNGYVWLFDCGEGTQHQFQWFSSKAKVYNRITTTPTTGTTSPNTLHEKEGGKEGGGNVLNSPEGKKERNASDSLPRPKNSRISKIFITHLHGDHCFGLPGLLASTSMAWGSLLSSSSSTSTGTKTGGGKSSSAHRPFCGASQYLEIYGPPGIGEFLRTSLRLSDSRFGFQFRVNEAVDASRVVHKTYSAEHKEIKGEGESVVADNGGDEDAFVIVDPYGEKVRLHPDEGPPRFVYPTAFPTEEGENKCENESKSEEGNMFNFYYDMIPAVDVQNGSHGITVMASCLQHRIFSLGYVLKEPTKPPQLDISKAIRMGVPKGPLLGKLKAGKDVSVDLPCSSNGDGGEKTKLIRACDVLSPSTPGQTAVFLGDTCNSDSILRTLTAAEPNSDSNSLSDRNGGVDWLVHECTFEAALSQNAAQHGHSTSAMAGSFAQRCKAKNLILTHFSARYDPNDVQQMNQLRHEAESAMSSEGSLLLQQQQSNAAEMSEVTPPHGVIIAEDFLSIDVSS